MTNRFAIRTSNALLRLTGRKEARKLHAAMANPRKSQLHVLRKILTANHGSAYGNRFSFASIKSQKDYLNAVPIVDYDAVVPWIERIKSGEKGVLTSESVLMFEKSSGSTAASKYVPYTQSLRKEFQIATSAWIYDLLTHRPKLRSLSSYWSISPVTQQPEVTVSGIRVGFENDTEYFEPIERWMLQQLMAVPDSVKKISDMASWRYITLRHLLNRPDLGFISIWNPTFLTLLLKDLEVQGDNLVRDLERGTLTPPQPIPSVLRRDLSFGLQSLPQTAERLRSMLRGGQPINGTELWPNLQLISCWDSGISGCFLPELQEQFPGVEIQGKGLLATEGVVSIPLLGHPGAVPALNSHYFEFIPVDANNNHLSFGIHELEIGKRYSILLTTGGGLYRYALHDIIEVVGYLKETPLIKFIGKSGKISDIVGEKLNELHVESILEELISHTKSPIRFAMLAPELESPPRYYCYLESSSLSAEEAQNIANWIDTKLRSNHHYAYARDLGQLGSIKSMLINEGAMECYLARCISLGQRAGNVKPSALHGAFGWYQSFSANKAEGL